MARIRTIKPEFWTDQKLAPLDALTRLVFLALISNADDAGRLDDNIRKLDGMMFSETDDTCLEALRRLSGIGVITRGETTTGQRVIQITGWDKHQKVSHRNDKACLQPISRGAPENLRSDSGGAPASTYDQRPTTYDQRPESTSAAEPPDSLPSKEKPKSKAKATIEALSFPEALDTTEARTAVSEWIEHRKQKREPVTPLAVEKLLKQWSTAGPAAFVEAIDHSIANGWTGVFAPKNVHQNGHHPTIVDDDRRAAGQAAHAHAKSLLHGDLK